MDTNRLRTGEIIAAVAGLLLFIVMFLGWFGISVEDLGGLSSQDIDEMAEAFPNAGDDGADSVTFSAWESMSFIDIILAITALVAVGLAAAKAAARNITLPVAASALTAGLGLLSTILILYRIIDPPFSLNRELWVFVGLVLAAAIAYGGWRSMQEEGTTFAGEADRLQDRVSDREPPPPPPAGGTGTGAPPGGPAV